MTEAEFEILVGLKVKDLVAFIMLNNNISHMVDALQYL